MSFLDLIAGEIDQHADAVPEYFMALLSGERVMVNDEDLALMLVAGELDAVTIHSTYAQILEPTSDVDAGGWSAPVWSDISGRSPGVGSTSVTLGSFESDLFEVHVGNPGTTPTVDTGHILRVRLWEESGGNGTWSARVLEGASSIASFSPVATSVATSLSFPLSTGQASGISDYTDLRIEIEVTCEAISGTYDFYCSWAVLWVPPS